MSSTSDEEVAVGAVVNFMNQPGRIDIDNYLGSQNENDFDANRTLREMADSFAEYRMEQYAQSVCDYSSQYGSDYSISYTAPNITGRESKYPNYGDYPETFAMRTYGKWWEKAPSHITEIQSQNMPKIPVDDFIVMHFENFIIPSAIRIYETFNPGAVVRIWAYTITKTWTCLWETKNLSSCPPQVPNVARIFTPPLKKSNLPTKIIRLEFNHTNLNYFTQIDAVVLCGNHIKKMNIQKIIDFYNLQRKGSILHKLQNIQFRPVFKESYENSLQNFLLNDLNKFIVTLPKLKDNEKTTKEVNAKDSEQVGLRNMPFDIMLNIFKYLDLISLFRVGQVSRFFYEVSTHPLLYCELNLKPYWHLATSDLLSTLAKRATVLRKMDLSWCGPYNTISSTEFKKFIQQRGDTLTHLRLNSCKFLNASCIVTLGIVCDNLKELCLRKCTADSPHSNYTCLSNLKNLERLDLSQTSIEPELLLVMLENNRKLKHLNLAFSGVAINMDEVALHIGAYNQQLISLDMWKSHFLSAIGLQALSNCIDLEELDLGWCLREAILGDSLIQLLRNCTKLKKLFLATTRGITDRDVQSIANLCENLEQLDLMGVLGVPKERYFEVLVKCKKLQLLDLCFCDNIDEATVFRWAHSFKVDIKYSLVPHDSRY